jgi:hypothetical protein
VKGQRREQRWSMGRECNSRQREERKGKIIILSLPKV